MDTATLSSSTELSPPSTRRYARHLEEVGPRLRGLAGAFARDEGLDPDDLYQTAVEVAWRAVPEYDSKRGACFYTFIFLDVRSAMRSACAEQKRERAFGRAVQRHLSKRVHDDDVMKSSDADVPFLGDRLAVGAGAVAETLAGPGTPEDRLAEVEEREMVRVRVEAALAMLDAMEREIVVRKDVEGQTIADAARALGVTYHQARTRYLGARERLVRLLG